MCFIGLLAALALPFAGEDALPEVPSDGVIRLTDHGFRDWGPELLHYSLDTSKFKPGNLELSGPDGKPVPFQAASAGGKSILSFVGAVSKGKSVAYTLRASNADGGKAGSALVHGTSGASVELGNAFFTLRLPKPGSKAYPEPAAAGDVPAPIGGWKKAGREWSGGSRFFTDRRVAAYEISCVEQGPVSVVYRARYRFAPKGEYVWQVRVSDGVPVAHVTEEYDLGEIGEGKDFLLLEVGAGWAPSRIGLPAGENATQTAFEPLAALVQKKSREQGEAVKNVSPHAPPPLFRPGRDLILIDRLSPGAAWGPKAGLELRSDDGADAVSVCPVFPGSWRRSNNPSVWSDPSKGLFVSLPIGVRLSRWYLDLTDDQSPFSMHEHDPGLAASYGRRAWALGFGHVDPVAVRKTLGLVGLDRYKGWILEWPEDRKKAEGRHAFLEPKTVARLKAALDRHPEKDLLATLWTFSGNRDHATANANRFIASFQNPYFKEWETVGLPGYYAGYWMHQSVFAEDALACPDLPADLRLKARRMLALYSYYYSDPDRDLRGSGSHEGTPNMAIGRGLGLGLVAAVIPDHPLYRPWMERFRDYVRYKLASNTEPGGAWFEPPTYQLYGPTRALTAAHLVLKNSGFGDLAAEGWQARTLDYLAHLTMPDARFKGWRIIPGMGNSGNTLEGIFGMNVGVVEGADRAEAGFLKAMHGLVSGNRRTTHGGDQVALALGYLPDVPDTARPLGTAFIPGYGVVFRAHYGSPDETALLFRCGYNKSHWDMDDLNVVLYGKGAPLSPGTGYQYYYGPAMQNNAVYHNRVQVGKLNAPQVHGRVDNTVQDYGFGDSCDYAMGRLCYPPEVLDDGRGEMEWRRHILFLKGAKPEGANYFVFRDTFPGGKDRPTWWHWLNLDGADMIAQEGRTVDMKTKHGAATHFWFSDPELAAGQAALTFDYGVAPNYHHRAFGKSLGVPDQDSKETKTIYRIAGKPGADYFYVVYPRKDGEKPPSCESLGEGCLRIATGESTDYVFAGDAAGPFDRDGVVFTGKAGAVRVFADRVAFCMNSGSGRIGLKGHVFEGHGPFERTVPASALKAGVTKVEGGYEKKTQAADLGNGLTVAGEGPFEARLDAGKIRIRTSGRARVLTMARPDFIRMPQLLVDGREWMAAWTDLGGSAWGRYKDSNRIAVTAPEGDHELVIRDREWLPLDPRPFRPLIEGVLIGTGAGEK